jgi:hypothetical protein
LPVNFILESSLAKRRRERSSPLPAVLDVCDHP